MKPIRKLAQLICCLLSLLAINRLSAQSTTIDSLTKLVSTLKDDKAKVDTYIKLVEELIDDREEERKINNINDLILIGTIIIIAVVSVFIFLLLFIHNKRRMTQQNNLLQLTALKSQMKIHSVSGSLHSVDSYLLNNTPEKASEYLSNYADYIRKIILTSATPEYSLAEELSYCQQFLNLEQYRCNNCFDYLITIATDVVTESVLVPSLMLVPMVENAVKHGVQSLVETNASRKGKVTIEVLMVNQTLICRVVDNGLGLNYTIKNKSNHPSYSTKGMEERIAIYNSIAFNKLTYTVTNLDVGVVAELTIKLPKKN